MIVFVFLFLIVSLILASYVSNRFVKDKKKSFFLPFFILILAPFFEVGAMVSGGFNEESFILTNICLIISFLFLIVKFWRFRK